MYLDYYSLDRHPFRITPDTSLFFAGGNRGRGVVLDAMLFAIENGEGILKVVGEVGSGKTMLCRMLEEKLPETTEIVYLANPNLAPDEILYAVAFELKLPVRRDTSKLLVMQQLQNYLLKQHAENRKVLVVIEEAQGMPVDTLEEIRLFSNLETHRDKLMQIILFGQPELDKNLSAKHIRQLRERITHSFYLDPMGREQTAEYIRFRLGAAGCPCPQLLTPSAEWLLTKASGGLTRRINILADKALLAGFAENILESRKPSVEMSPVITWRHIYAAIRDSDYIAPVFHKLLSPLRFLSAGLVLAVVVLSFMLWSDVEQVLASNSTVPESDNRAELIELNTLGGEKLPSEENVVVAVELKATPVPLASGEGQASVETVAELALAEESIEPQLDQPEINGLIASADVVDETLVDGKPEKHSIEEASDDHAADSAITAAATPGISNLNINLGSVGPEGFEVGDWGDANEYSFPIETDIASAKPDLAPSEFYVQDRMIASNTWMQESGLEGYTVQFMSGRMSNLDFAESFLRVLENFDMISDSYFCMSEGNEQGSWTIKYGNFSGVSVAQNFIENLPAEIYEYRPFVQNMNRVVCNSNPSVASLNLE